MLVQVVWFYYFKPCWTIANEHISKLDVYWRTSRSLDCLVLSLNNLTVVHLTSIHCLSTSVGQGLPYQHSTLSSPVVLFSSEYWVYKPQSLQRILGQTHGLRGETLQVTKPPWSYTPMFFNQELVWGGLFCVFVFLFPWFLADAYYLRCRSSSVSALGAWGCSSGNEVLFLPLFLLTPRAACHTCSHTFPLVSPVLSTPPFPPSPTLLFGTIFPETSNLSEHTCKRTNVHTHTDTHTICITKSYTDIFNK